MADMPPEFAAAVPGAIGALALVVLLLAARWRRKP